MNSKSVENLRIIYILYLIGAFIGATMFVGVILAYIERGKISDRMLQSHVEKQIRVFWIWLVVLVVLSLGVLVMVIPTMISLPLGDSVFLGDSMWVPLASIFSIFILSLSVPFVLFLYVLITSIRSLNRLDAGEWIGSF